MMEFMETYKYEIFVILFGLAGMTAITLYAQLVMMRVQATESRKHLNYMSRQYEELVKSLLKKVDERTADGLNYELIRSIFGDVEAADYQREAIRVTGKLGLRPGYYKSDVAGTFCRVTNFSAVDTFDSPESGKAKKARQSLSSSKRFRVLRRDGFKCQLCGFEPGDETGGGLHVDHKMPKSKGGSDDDENLWTLCDKCNLGKSDLVLGELFSIENE